MIGAWCWRVLWLKVNPFVLQGLKLSQIIEVGAAFPSVTSKEEDAVLKGEAVGA